MHATCEVWESHCGGQRKTGGLEQRDWGCLQTGGKEAQRDSRQLCCHFVPGVCVGFEAVLTRSVCDRGNLTDIILLDTPPAFGLRVQKLLSLPSNDYAATMFHNVGKGTGDQTRAHHRSVTQRVILGFRL